MRHGKRHVKTLWRGLFICCWVFLLNISFFKRYYSSLWWNGNFWRGVGIPFLTFFSLFFIFFVLKQKSIPYGFKYNRMLFIQNSQKKKEKKTASVSRWWLKYLFYLFFVQFFARHTSNIAKYIWNGYHTYL